MDKSKFDQPGYRNCHRHPILPFGPTVPPGTAPVENLVPLDADYFRRLRQKERREMQEREKQFPKGGTAIAVAS